MSGTRPAAWSPSSSSLVAVPFLLVGVVAVLARIARRRWA